MMTNLKRETDSLAEITQETIFDHLGDTAWISKNLNGIVYLNSKNLWIVDIEFRELYLDELFFINKNGFRLPIFETLAFGEAVSEVDNEDRQSLVKGAIEFALERMLDGSYRIYETHQGLRLIRIDQPMIARSQDSVFRQLLCYTDVSYSELCIHQDCFRARLTPKAWRINRLEKPRVTHFLGDVVVRTNDEEINNTVLFHDCEPHPQLKSIVNFHDHVTGAFSNTSMIA